MPPALSPRSRSGVVPTVRRLLRTYSFGFALLVSLALLIANLLTESGGFGWTQQMADFAPLGLAAIASTPAIISGGFDFTISPLIFLTNAVFVIWLLPHGLGGAISVPIVLALGAAVGALQAVLIIVLRIPSVVVTLGLYFILIGVDYKIAPNAVSISSSWLTHLSGSVGPIPGALFTLGAPFVIWFALRFIPYRGVMFAVGSNEATAYSTGVNVGLVRICAYALGGLFAGIGGLALTGLVLSTNSSLSGTYTLIAIAGVGLGGTSLWGGRGGLLGSMLGAVVIYLLGSLLSALQVDPNWLQVMYGGMLLVAVVVGGKLALPAKQAA